MGTPHLIVHPLSHWRLDGPAQIIFPLAAAGYWAVRLTMIVLRNWRR